MQLTGTCSRCGNPHKYDPKTGKMIGACVSGKTRRGAEAEALLAAQLTEAGFYDTTHKERPDGVPASWCFRRQYPFGLLLVPERGFAADFVFLAHSLKVEIDGGAHAAGRKKVGEGTDREGLAATVGLRNLPLRPERLYKNEAVDMIKAAIQSAALNQSARAEGG